MSFCLVGSEMCIRDRYKAIHTLKNGRASGPDGMISEFLKNSAGGVVPFLIRSLNKLFCAGCNPDDWSEAATQPLHTKKATRTYLTSTEARPCCTQAASSVSIHYQYQQKVNSIVRRSIRAKPVSNRSYSTVDHLFTLVVLIQKQLCNHRKLHVAFVDFRKAFDSVIRTDFWNIL